MTELLQRAFAAIAQLPEAQQKAIAFQLLTELEDDAIEIDPEFQQNIEEARIEYLNGEFITLAELKAERTFPKSISDMIDQLAIIQSENPIDIDIPERGDRSNFLSF